MWMKMTPKMKNDQKAPILGQKHLNLGRIGAILDIWTHFSLTLNSLEIVPECSNEDLAFHKKTFFETPYQF